MLTAALAPENSLFNPKHRALMFSRCKVGATRGFGLHLSPTQKNLRPVPHQIHAIRSQFHSSAELLLHDALLCHHTQKWAIFVVWGLCSGGTHVSLSRQVRTWEMTISSLLNSSTALYLQIHTVNCTLAATVHTCGITYKRAGNRATDPFSVGPSAPRPRTTAANATSSGDRYQRRQSHILRGSNVQCA